ncbi:hypothetical protein [uncultured Aquimarina sp.]|uniref:hypothetical protein n=1 Tax=uncultured Aquimarina sp. TaxID=575652 RepID=UPI0026207786|nr:hypothetical protein [uncultured Aquimarina sp.]
MLNIFKKSIKKEIAELSNEILNVIVKNGFETDSCGIKDGNEIITEYLTKNELGLAYEHLEYVISETELSLNSEQTKTMIFIAGKLGIKK